jgi:hypothetical protein
MRQEIKLGSWRKIAVITLYRKATVGPAEKMAVMIKFGEWVGVSKEGNGLILLNVGLVCNNLPPRANRSVCAVEVI